MRKKKELPQNALKALGVVYELSLEGLSPSRDGILAILHGGFEYDSFSSLVLFGSLTSLSGKKLSSILRFLLSKELLEEKEVIEQGETYYLLKKRGETMAKEFLSHYHKPAMAKTRAEHRKYLPLDQVGNQ